MCRDRRSGWEDRESSSNSGRSHHHWASSIQSTFSSEYELVLEGSNVRVSTSKRVDLGWQDCDLDAHVLKCQSCLQLQFGRSSTSHSPDQGCEDFPSI